LSGFFYLSERLSVLKDSALVRLKQAHFGIAERAALGFLVSVPAKSPGILRK
jgi:hypothetical protein